MLQFMKELVAVIRKAFEHKRCKTGHFFFYFMYTKKSEALLVLHDSHQYPNRSVFFSSASDFLPETEEGFVWQYLALVHCVKNKQR